MKGQLFHTKASLLLQGVKKKLLTLSLIGLMITGAQLIVSPLDVSAEEFSSPDYPPYSISAGIYVLEISPYEETFTRSELWQIYHDSGSTDALYDTLAGIPYSVNGENFTSYHDNKLSDGNRVLLTVTWSPELLDYVDNNIIGTADKTSPLDFTITFESAQFSLNITEGEAADTIIALPVDLEGKIYKTVHIIDDSTIVNVHYKDESGGQIADSVQLQGYTGRNYACEQKDIYGYTLKEIKGSETGSFTDETQEVTYVYTKNPTAAVQGIVNVQYTDENGSQIADTVQLKGNVGESYKSEQKNIVGYTFKKIKGNADGSYTEAAQEITYVYTKNTDKQKSGSSDKNNTDTKDNSDTKDSSDTKDKVKGRDTVHSKKATSKAGKSSKTGDQLSPELIISLGGIFIGISGLLLYIKKNKKSGHDDQ